MILPLVAVISLFGCAKDRTVQDIQKLYTTTTTEHFVKDDQVFFSNELDSNLLCIYYPDDIMANIQSEYPSTDEQKRFKALDYQQKILTNIFMYYSNNQENFFKVAESKNIDDDVLNNLYNKLQSLNDELDAFVSSYETFVNAASDVSSIIEYSITLYTFKLNRVIDKSFDFMYEFHNVYTNYCIDDYSVYSEKNIRNYIDKAYLDLSYIVYLENIKAFNFSKGENGICDLADVVGNNTKYNMLEMLDSRKSISYDIIGNLNEDATNYLKTKENLNTFIYTRNVYNQKLKSYLANYNNLDVYNINSYKFNQVGGISYDNYISSLSSSERATVIMLDNFVQDNFKNYVEKLNYLVG